MAVPKKKISYSKTRQRRTHLKANLVNVVADATTGELKRPHHVSSDGYYNRKKVTDSKVNH